MSGQPNGFWKFIAVGAMTFIAGQLTTRLIGIADVKALEKRLETARTECRADADSLRVEIAKVASRMDQFDMVPRFGAGEGMVHNDCIGLNFRLHDQEARGASVSASDREQIVECRERLKVVGEILFGRMTRSNIEKRGRP